MDRFVVRLGYYEKIGFLERILKNFGKDTSNKFLFGVFQVW